MVKGQIRITATRAIRGNLGRVCPPLCFSVAIYAVIIGMLSKENSQVKRTPLLRSTKPPSVSMIWLTRSLLVAMPWAREIKAIMKMKEKALMRLVFSSWIVKLKKSLKESGPSSWI